MMEHPIEPTITGIDPGKGDDRSVVSHHFTDEGLAEHDAQVRAEVLATACADIKANPDAITHGLDWLVDEARAEERERCARKVECWPVTGQRGFHLCQQIAADIRAGSDPPEHPDTKRHNMLERAIGLVSAITCADATCTVQFDPSETEEAINLMREWEGEKVRTRASQQERDAPSPEWLAALRRVWPTLNRERGRLIDIGLNRSLSEEEASLMAALQAFADLYIGLAAPHPAGQLDKLEATLGKRVEEES